MKTKCDYLIKNDEKAMQESVLFSRICALKDSVRTIEEMPQNAQIAFQKYVLTALKVLESYLNQYEILVQNTPNMSAEEKAVFQAGNEATKVWIEIKKQQYLVENNEQTSNLTI